LAGSLLDTIFVVQHTENGQEFFINPGFAVSELVFDPNNHLVSGAETINKIPVISTENQFKIIPNPAFDHIRIENTGNFFIEKITIIGVSGKILYEQNVQGNENEYQFNIQRFPQGTYFFKIKSSNQNYLYKFVKKD